MNSINKRLSRLEDALQKPAEPKRPWLIVEQRRGDDSWRFPGGPPLELSDYEEGLADGDVEELASHGWRFIEVCKDYGDLDDEE